MPMDEQRPVRVHVWDERQNPSAPVQMSARDALIVVNGSPLIHGDVPTGDGRTSAAALSKNAQWTLFAPGAADALTNHEQIARCWSRAGLLRHAPSVEQGLVDWRETVQEALRDGWRVYTVSVFHLEVIAIQRYRSIGTGITATPMDRTVPYRELCGQELTKQLGSDPALRRVTRVAVRAIYSLGLDLGIAIVAIDGDGRTAALAVRQIPTFHDDDGSPWAEALGRFRTMYAHSVADGMNLQGGESEALSTTAAYRSSGSESRKRILIGADPEFVLIKENGRIASADRYFGVGGGAGADALLVGQRLMYPIGELRPDPASTPDELAANVRRQLIRADAKADDHSLRWVAGAMPISGVALGGHIHVSGIPMTSRLLRQLDRYVALPIAMIESDSGRRPRYGMLGDFRQQSHGGFEYRTLPSWLVSPAAAKAAFALTLLCAHDTWSLPTPPMLPERVEEAFYRGDRRTLVKQLDGIAAELAASPSYAAYAHWIEPLFSAARQGTVWDEAADIRRKWRVGPYAK